MAKGSDSPDNKKVVIGRCRACGERIYAGDELMRVSAGRLYESGDLEDFDDSGVWGYMHKPCFLLAIRDPEAIAHTM